MELFLEVLHVYQCWTWTGFRIAIQPDSTIQNGFRVGLEFEKISLDRIGSNIWIVLPDEDRTGLHTEKIGLD